MSLATRTSHDHRGQAGPAGAVPVLPPARFPQVPSRTAAHFGAPGVPRVFPAGQPLTAADGGCVIGRRC
jgi:hypothetical protein